MFVFMARLVTAARRGHVLVLAGLLVAVVLVGAELYALAEGIAFSTGLYWAITTATTVGYGDVTPHNGLGRLIASLFMLVTIPMLGALFALLAGVSISNGIRRIMSSSTDLPANGHRLVVGSHPAALAVAADLARCGEPVVLVADADPATVPDAVHLVHGDPTEATVLARARPAHAQDALVTGSSDGDVLVIAVLLRRAAPDLPLTALAGAAAVREALTDLGVAQALSADDLVAHTLAKTLEAPHAGGLLDELVDSDDTTLVEQDVPAADVGRRLSAVRDDREGLVLGLARGGMVTLGLADDPVLAAGDRLLVAVARERRRSRGDGSHRDRAPVRRDRPPGGR